MINAWELTAKSMMGTSEKKQLFLNDEADSFVKYVALYLSLRGLSRLWICKDMGEDH